MDRVLGAPNLPESVSTHDTTHDVQQVNIRPHVFSFLSFRYRVYPKQCAIQLKPEHDKTNHFSIIWTKDKKSLAKDFPAIEAEIRNYITSHGNKLHFTILRVCTNCTYGRFDDRFEEMIINMRAKYPAIYTGKDLTIGDPKHVDLNKSLQILDITWDESHPIIHHIHGRSKTGDVIADTRWESIFRGSTTVDMSDDKLGNTVLCEINFDDDA